MFMFEKALTGSRKYWAFLACLAAVILAGLLAFLREEEVGLAVTALSRDVPWGLYIAQFVFCIGLGASAAVVVVPYYIHDSKAFGKITILGELLGMCSVIMAMLFIFVSMGQPQRVLNVLLYPHPNSLIFWDLLVLSGYVLLNAVITVNVLQAERLAIAPPKWIKFMILLSVPWAIGIHTVTAFLLSGLVARSFWMTPLMAPRFLASAFASGPALLILMLLMLRWLKMFDAGAEALRKLATIVTYSMLINLFFLAVEAFTVFYSGIQEPIDHYQYLFLGLEGHAPLAAPMWISLALSVAGVLLLLVPKWRANTRLLSLACVFVFASLWLEKGLGLITGGFTPSPMEAVTPYVPNLPEWEVVVGIWALGALMITVLYRIVLSVRQENYGIGVV
jgi:Ni/Fe-hydrogenase subunit HybB-like protein